MDKNYIIHLQSDCISYSRKLERIRNKVDELREMLGFYNRRLSELDYGSQEYMIVLSAVAMLKVCIHKLEVEI